MRECFPAQDDTALIVYKDGPAFERACPKCGRFMKWPSTYRYRIQLDEAPVLSPVKCSKCGLVEPTHVGWDGDF